MALVMQWRYSWFFLFFIVFIGLNGSLAKSDEYYEYHSIHPRSVRNDSNATLKDLTSLMMSMPILVHVNESATATPVSSTANTSQAPGVPLNPLLQASGVNYTTTNVTQLQHVNVDKTSQQVLNSTLNATVMQDKNMTTPFTNSTGTTGNNSTVIVPEGIPAEDNSSSTTDSNDFTLNEFKTISNETLKKNNITKCQTDYHQYYNSSFIIDNETVGNHYWVDMNHPGVIVNDMLSQSHRRAVTVKLTFDFPFYGHIVRNVTVATGGFLYTGEYVHSWLAATQYIAPLMANFDTSISNDSFVKYMDNGTAFTVLWEKVVLQDKPSSGDFTFQATLHQNGDIVFVYQNVPMIIKNIEDHQHPVKVGLSDAYIIDRTIFFVRRKTIYEYHRVDFGRQEIKNWTVIVLKALPTCVDNKDCESCLSSSSGFQCLWCPGASRCSTGTDRNRQDWLHKGCDKTSFAEKDKCPAVAINSTNTQNAMNNHIADGNNPAAQVDHSIDPKMTQDEENVNMGISGIIGILFIVALVASLGIWILYAYRNPHTASGQFLIRYRPSQWSWKRGEARYTAATIHM